MLSSKSQFIVDDNGKKTAVIIPIEEYESLLEDLADLSVMAERRNETSESLEAVRKRLKAKWRKTTQ